MPGVLAIVAFSPSRWDDYAAFKTLGVAHDVCCINRAGLEFPGKFKIWFSYHSRELLEWAAKRPGVADQLITAGKARKGVTKHTLSSLHGSSSLQAVRVARRRMGYGKMVLCGVELSGQYERAFFDGWMRAKNELLPYVRSMSGNTRELLGEPTKRWLYDNS